MGLKKRLPAIKIVSFTREKIDDNDVVTLFAEVNGTGLFTEIVPTEH